MPLIFVALSTLISCSWAGAEPPSARTELLTYGEVMQLTPEKRIQYFSDLALLLALMEQKTEGKYDVAALERLRERRREVAWWLDLLRPSAAEAADETAPGTRAAGDAPATSRPGAFSWMAAQLERNADWRKARAQAAAERVAGGASSNGAVGGATAEGTGATAPRAEATPGGAAPAPAAPSATSAPSGSPGPSGPYQTPPPRVGAPARPQTFLGGIDGKPFSEMNAGPATEVIDNCPVRPPKCETMTKKQRQDLIIDFRRSDEYNKCITAGYFSPKQGNRRAGSCAFKTKESFGKFGFSCDDGRTALCNPMLFCLRYDNLKYKTVAKGPEGASTTMQQLPIGMCVPRGPNVTRECYDRYNATLGIGPVKKRWDLIELQKSAKKDPRVKKKVDRLISDKVEPVACDFNTTSTEGLKEKFEQLRKETMDGYRELCELTPEKQARFAQLFCEECGIISKQLHAMLTRAGKPCGLAAPVPTGGTMAPASSGATREN